MTSPFDERLEAEKIARLFHDTYERLAPEYNYTTKKDTRVFDPESNNGKLMIAVAGEVEQAIRTLFLDLIAEAKPEKFQTIEIEWARGWRDAIDKYENNLIQAINGGKK
jgi:hypothetical protein